MDPVTQSIRAADGGLEIDFTAPSDNSETITAYKIEILHAGGWDEELTDCDGSQAAIVSNLQCVIPMSAFLVDPFYMAFDDVIEVRIQAYNAYGWGATSTSVAVETVRTVPQKMNTPVRDGTTSTTLLVLTWAELTTSTETGNSEILSYNVQWDQGTTGADWYHL
jgi:hypothetical protein